MKIIRVADPNNDVSTFINNIPKHRAVVMVYMMQGCPHCEHLKPQWDILKKIMHSDNNFDDVMMADIDSEVVSHLPLPPVMSFPNIKVLSGDKLTEYHGIREVDPLLSFIRKSVTTPRKSTKHKHTTHRGHISKHTHNNKSRHRTKDRHSTTRSKSSKRRDSSKRSKSRSIKRRGHNTTRRSKSV